MSPPAPMGTAGSSVGGLEGERLGHGLLVGSETHAEAVVEAAFAGRGEGDGATVFGAGDPAQRQPFLRKCGADRAADMRSPLGPVETGATHMPSALECRIVQVDAETSEIART